MTRRSSLLLLVVLVQVLGLSRLDAQPTLSGTLRDAGGSVLPGVSVIGTSPSLAGSRSVATDLEGRYSLGDLPDGPYTITFTLPGFVETTRSDIVLPAAAERPLDVVMRVGSLAETITILPGSRRGAPLSPQDQPAPTCTMRVIPVDRPGDAQGTGRDAGLHDQDCPAALPGFTPGAESLTGGARSREPSVHASRFTVLGSCSGSVHGSWFMVLGSGFSVRGSRFEVRSPPARRRTTLSS